MKKSLLLTALIASVASLAATTGTVELEVKNEMKAEKVNEVLTENKTSAKLKSEVKVANSGFSFGTELGLKELTLFKLGKKDSTQFEGFKTLKEKNDGSKVWAKYELPELKGFHSSVKAEYNIPEKIKAEVDANYEIKDKATLGYNTTSELKLGEKFEGKNITSTQKVYLNVTNPKFVDSKLEAEVKHDWQFEKKANKKLPEPKFSESVKDIRGEATLNYKVLDNLVLGGEAYIKYINFVDANGEGEYRNFLTGKKDEKFDKGLKHVGTDAAAFNLTYEKDKLKLENKVFLQHIFEPYNGTLYHSLFYGVNLKGTYIAVTNLTLTADTTLGGKCLDIKHNEQEYYGYIKADLGAKYDYKLIDTITLTPELNAKVIADDLSVKNEFPMISLEIKPKLSVAYKPIPKFTVSANAELPITLDNEVDGEKFEFRNVQIKPSVNIKYEW